MQDMSRMVVYSTVWLLLSGVLSAATPVEKHPAVTEPPTLEAVAKELETQRKQLESLQIELKSYTTVCVEQKDLLKKLLSWRGEEGKDLSVEEVNQFAFTGGKRYSHQNSSRIAKGPELREVTYNHARADDGTICWDRLVNLKHGPAYVTVYTPESKRRQRGQFVKQPEYFREIGWDCKTEVNTQDEGVLASYHSRDLLYLLQHGAYSIAEDAPQLDGAECVVLQRQFEVKIKPRGHEEPAYKVSEKVWLDRSHGLSVRQREEDVEEHGLTRTICGDFTEILPGIWFPKKMESQVLAPPDAPQEYRGRVVMVRHTDVVQCAANEVRDERFHVVTKPSDVYQEMRATSAIVRVIVAPSGLKSMTTLEGSREVTVASPPSTKPLDVPLTAESLRLVEALAVSATRSRATPPRVAIAKTPGCTPPGELVQVLESTSDCKCDCVTPAEMRAGALDRFDVVVFPGGSQRKHAEELGDDGRKAVRKFVESGGGYVGICAGAWLACSSDSALGLGLLHAPKLSVKREIAGPDGIMTIEFAYGIWGVVKLQVTDTGRRVLGDQPGLLDARYGGGPLFLPARKTDTPEYVCLAHYRSENWCYDWQRGNMIDTPAVLAAKFGHGHVIVFSPHPESKETPLLHSVLVRAVLATAQRPAARR